MSVVTRSIVATSAQLTVDQSRAEEPAGITAADDRPTTTSRTSGHRRRGHAPASTVAMEPSPSVGHARRVDAAQRRQVLRMALLEVRDPRNVMRPSTIDAPRTWATSIAGIAAFRSYGE